MLFLRPKLRISITRNTGYSTSKCSLGTVRDTGTKVVQLSFGFLFLTCGVLLTAGLFETLDEQVSMNVLFEKILGRGDGVGWKRRERTSEPIKPPNASFPDPIVWAQLPSVRLGSSFVMAPDEEAE